MQMKMIVAGFATLALAGLPGSASAAPQHQGSPDGSGVGTPSRQSTQSAPAAIGSGRADALTALQDSRVTLARLTEASMPENARQALARVSMDFRALYKAYTGEEPTPDKTAREAATSQKQPDPKWETSYDAVAAAIDGVIGKPGGSTAVTGTSGTAGPANLTSELTTPVRQDFEVLRQQLQRFHTAAGRRGSGGTTK
jgi:hypothetical protein